MKRETIQIISLSVLAVLYNYFFWYEEIGLNLFILNMLIVGILLFGIFPESKKNRIVQLTALFTMLASSMVLVHNSVISKLGYLVSFGVMVGFIHQNQLKTLFGAGMQYGLNVLFTLPQSFQFLGKQTEKLIGENRYSKFIFKNLPLMVIPLIVFFIFFVLFASSNPVLRDLLDALGENLSYYFGNFFAKISVGRIIFILIGIYFLFSVLFDWHPVKNINKAVISNDFVEHSEQVSANKVNNEFKIALMLIVSVNMLLAVVNIIDINFLWLNFAYSEAGNLSKLVHEGTYSLIFSILLSIAILLYFFRKDLNFYPKIKTLRFLAYTWIIQNVILAISVCIRNSYYIGFYGLTHKRIGVYLFLLLTVIGLLVLLLKIKHLKSFSYLFKINSWAWYLVLVGLTLVNWDMQIVRYNLSNQPIEKIDWDYLLNLSDRTIPAFYEHQDKFLNNSSVTARLEGKTIYYLKEQQNYSWLSWNYADYQVLKSTSQQ